MPVTNFPGVFVQEIPGGAPTIEGVSTTVTAFVGRVNKGPVGQVAACHGVSDFQRRFGGSPVASELAWGVRLFFENGGGECRILRLAPGAERAGVVLPNSAATDVLVLKAKSPGLWGNGLFVKVEHPESNAAGVFTISLYQREGRNVLVSESFANLSMNPRSPRFAPDVVSRDSELADLLLAPGLGRANDVPTPEFFQDPVSHVTFLPAPTRCLRRLSGGLDGAEVLTAADFRADVSGDGGIHALDALDVLNIVVVPRDSSIQPGEQVPIQKTVSEYVRQRRAFQVVDAPASWTDSQGHCTVLNLPEAVNDFRVRHSIQDAAVYYPDGVVNENGIARRVGLSGAVAGLYVRTDLKRGVWKAPAGIEAEIRGISGTAVRLKEEELGVLNSRGVNVFKWGTEAGGGSLVCWGARTLAGAEGSGSEWRYVPVRRLALFLEESIQRGIQWVVFEPSDEAVWAKLRVSVEGFLSRLFRKGAFQGKTASEAFFVRCGRDTMTELEVQEGFVKVVFGFAPLKPAEFVVISVVLKRLD